MSDISNRQFNGDTVSELSLTKSTQRDLIQELFGKPNVNKIIDRIEAELGRPTATVKVKVKYHNRIFNLNLEEDIQLMNELLNEPERFTIIMWKDTWTVHGEFKVFVIYAETLKPEVKKGTDENQL